jgi:HTH-type transcriptional regulator/antitoxin HipB
VRIRSATDLGAFLRDRRTAQRLTLDGLAAKAGVSRRWLAGVEAGKSGAAIGLVFRTLAALDLELDASDIPTASSAIDLDDVLARLDRDDPEPPARAEGP